MTAQLKTVIPRLKAVVGKGEFAFKGDIEKARKLIANLTAVTKREVALLVLPDGRTVMRIGGQRTVSSAGASKVVAHSHPNGFLMLSERVLAGEAADTAVLAGLKQTETFLVGPAGDLVRWQSPSATWMDDLIGTIINGGN